jgi:hypothetical protein
VEMNFASFLLRRDDKYISSPEHFGTLSRISPLYGGEDQESIQVST